MRPVIGLHLCNPPVPQRNGRRSVDRLRPRPRGARSLKFATRSIVLSKLSDNKTDLGNRTPQQLSVHIELTPNKSGFHGDPLKSLPLVLLLVGLNRCRSS